jgi:catechol 2,3-dioxygenase-like lactoylglutathione lyase family enzyme
MRLDQIDLVCADVARSLEFYRLLGVDIPDEKVWGTASGPHHCEVDAGDGVSLAFSSVPLARVYNKGYRPARGGSNMIGFRVGARADVDAAYARLEGAGHRGVQPPNDAFWGARFAIVEDPDGNHVAISSASDAAYRGAGPEL